MPFKYAHSARVRDPKDFMPATMRTKIIDKDKGVSQIEGKLKGGDGSMVAQAWRFDADKFTPEQARAWCKEHDVKPISFEPAKREMSAEDINEALFNKKYFELYEKKYGVEQTKEIMINGLGKDNYEKAIADIKELDFGALHNLTGIEIFATGEWKGDTYTNDDLVQIESAFNELYPRIEPAFKLGHDHTPQAPAVGWLTKVYKQGNKLFADIKDIPAKVYEMIKDKMYKKVSAELWLDYEDSITKKKYKRTLAGVALLGANLPAVNTLNEIVVNSAKYKVMCFAEMDIKDITEIGLGASEVKLPAPDDDGNAEKVKHDNKESEVFSMTPEEQKMIDDKMAKLQTEVDAAKKVSADLVDKTTKQFSAFELELKKTKEQDIVKFIDDNSKGAVIKILPFEKPLVEQIFAALTGDNVIEFSVNNVAQKATTREMFKKFIAGLPGRVPTGELASAEKSVDFSKNEPQVVNGESTVNVGVAAKAEELMKADKTLTYTAALKLAAQKGV